MKNGDVEENKGDTPPFPPNSPILPPTSPSFSINSPLSIPASPSSFSAYSQTKGTATKVKSFMISKLSEDFSSRPPPNSTPTLTSRTSPLLETKVCKAISPVPHLSSHIYSPVSSPVAHPSAYIDTKPCKTSPLSSPVPHPTTYIDTKPYKTSPLSSPVPHPSTYIDTKPYKTSPLSSPVPYPSAYIDAKPCKTSPLSSPVPHPSTYIDTKPYKTSPLSSPVPNLTTCVETKPFTTSPVSIAEAKYTPHHLHLETKPCKKSPLSSPVSVTPMYSPFLSKHTSLSSHAFLPNNSSRPMPPLQPLNNIGYSYQSISQPHQYLPQTQPLSLCMPRPQARSPQPLPQPRSPLQPLLPKKRPRSEVFEEEDCLVSPPVSPDMPDTPFFPAHMAHKRKIARWSVASSPIFPTPSPSITSSPPLPLTPTSVAIPALIRMPHEVCSEGGVLASYTSTLAAGKEWDALHYKNAFLNSHRGTSTLYSSLPSALAIHPSHYSSSRHNNYHHVKRQRAHTPSRTSLIHSTASIRPSAVPAAHPDSYYRDRTRLKEAPTSPASSHQSLSRPTNTWSGGAMIPTLPPHPPRPTPLSSGNQNRPTLLSPDMHLQYAGHSPTLLGQPEPPSAVSKKWQHTNEECVFDKKEISEWEYKDFVQFMFNAYEHLGLDNSTFDLDFSKVSNTLPPLRLEETLFKQISKNHGEVLYRYFQSFLDLKREREAQAQQAKFCSQNRISSSGYTVASEGSTHHPSMQDTPVTMDTPARYEIHYKTIEDKRLGYDTNGMMGLPQNMTMPSAALKNFPSMLPQSSILNQNGTMNPEHSTHEEVKPEVPKKRGPGRPRKPESERKNKKKKTGRLWEFIRNLLLDPSTCPSLVRWENAEEGMFRFIQAEKVAHRWGDRKKNGDMNYEKLSRAMRYYYKTQIFEAVLGRRLVYKFGKNAKNWRPTNPSDPNFQEYHQQYQAG